MLGADRVRAVGVEPDREAAARFRASVALNGWGEAVSVVEVRVASGGTASLEGRKSA